VLLEGFGKLKRIHLIATRTRDLPACSIAPQPTTPPCALYYYQYIRNSIVKMQEVEHHMSMDLHCFMTLNIRGFCMMSVFVYESLYASI
jgi:hypothetical protein